MFTEDQKMLVEAMALLSSVSEKLDTMIEHVNELQAIIIQRLGPLPPLGNSLLNSPEKENPIVNHD